MSYIVMHPSEVEHWKRLFTASGMTLVFQCNEQQPMTDAEVSETWARYEIDVTQRPANRAARRARHANTP